MGKGLLAWWRRRIVARGLAGAILLSVPVAVAALIGFGTSFSGVAGGLSAVTSGPGAAQVSAPTRPRSLNQAVVALASQQTSAGPTSDGAANGGGGSGGGASTLTPDSGTGSGTGSGSGGGSPVSQGAPTVSAPSAPNISLPGGGSGSGGGGGGGTVNGAVNDVLGNVDKTVNGLLGQ